MKKRLCTLVMATVIGLGVISTSTFAAVNKVPNEQKSINIELKTIKSEIKEAKEKIKASKETNKDAIKNAKAKGIKKSVINDSIKDLEAEKEQIFENNKSLKSEVSTLKNNVTEAKQNTDISSLSDFKKSIIEKKTLLKDNLDKMLSIGANILSKLNSL